MKVQILNLNPSFDHTGILKHKTDADIIRVDEVVGLTSGKGINVGRTLKLLGHNNYIVANLTGGNVGKLIEDSLNQEGIQSWNYRIKSDSRINYILVNEIEDKVFVINENGPMITPQEKENYLEQLLEWLEKGQIFVLSGSALIGFTEKHIQKLLKEARAKNMYTVIDTNKKFLTASLKESPDLIKINEEEFSTEFQGTNLPAEYTVEDILKIIDREKLKKIIVTLGKRGAIFYNQGKAWYGQVKKIYSNYAVGSGDSFLGGYLYAYSHNQSDEDCFKLALACGVANTKIYGPGKIDYNDVEEIKDNYVEIHSLLT